MKILVSDMDDVRFYDKLLRNFGNRIYFQPEWGTMESSVPCCIEACVAYRGALSVQAHKFLGLP